MPAVLRLAPQFSMSNSMSHKIPKEKYERRNLLLVIPTSARQAPASSTSLPCSSNFIPRCKPIEERIL
jgi:hypothetical protein